jgi:hypothetical protein
MNKLMVKWRCDRCGSAYKFEDDEVPIAPFKCTRSMSPNDMAVRTQICGGEVKDLGLTSHIGRGSEHE